ncbi:hypothetical protein BDV19DRAFT_384815 [Aspergillus venezuelensis]
MADPDIIMQQAIARFRTCMAAANYKFVHDRIAEIEAKNLAFLQLYTQVLAPCGREINLSAETVTAMAFAKDHRRLPVAEGLCKRICQSGVKQLDRPGLECLVARAQQQRSL